MEITFTIKDERPEYDKIIQDLSHFRNTLESCYRVGIIEIDKFGTPVRITIRASSGHMRIERTLSVFKVSPTTINRIISEEIKSLVMGLVREILA